MRTSIRTIRFVAPALLAWLGCDPAGTSEPPRATPSAATTSAPAVTRASIAIDDAHDTMKKGAPYSIAKAAELVLDGSSHVFTGVDAAGFGRPNAIHVAHGPSEYYRATFDGRWPVTLGSRSLDPVKGGAFGGFEPGEYIVAVGAEGPSNDGTMRFAPAWVTTVVVTP